MPLQCLFLWRRRRNQTVSVLFLLVMFHQRRGATVAVEPNSSQRNPPRNMIFSKIAVLQLCHFALATKQESSNSDPTLLSKRARMASFLPLWAKRQSKRLFCHSPFSRCEVGYCSTDFLLENIVLRLQKGKDIVREIESISSPYDGS